MNNKGSSAKTDIAIAFREMAENAQTINNLNITPDLLQSLTEESEEQIQYWERDHRKE